MDAGDGVKRLVLQAVDPELLEVVVGPRLAPAWVKPLRAQYARFKQAYPADWADVEEVWRKQRARKIFCIGSPEAHRLVELRDRWPATRMERRRSGSAH